jgi:poly(3-hydroxybutyrate) depolymerase
LALFLTFTSVIADTAGCGKAPTLTSGTKTMTVNGKSRRWIVRLPNNYDRTIPHRLVFGVHWRDADYGAVDGGSAPYYGLRSRMNNTIFVAPDGLNKGWANSGGEDITFFDQIIKAVSDDLCINEKLIFSLGFSYGGAMSYSLACSRPKVVRAVAILSGALLSGCASTTEPVVCSPLSCERWPR